MPQRIKSKPIDEAIAILLEDPEMQLQCMRAVIENDPPEVVIKAFALIRRELLTPREEAILTRRIRDLQASGNVSAEEVKALLGLRPRRGN